MILTLKQAVAARGIDEKRVSANWRRRCRSFTGDRPKYWPDTELKTSFLYRNLLGLDGKAAEKALSDLKGAAYAIDQKGVSTYIASWSFLNHLKGN